MKDIQQIEGAITALEAQRTVLGDAVTDFAVEPLRARLAHLRQRHARPVPSLRQVSVLFMDVVGSTELTRELGNEDAGTLLRDALARFAACVEAQRGRVLRFQGDGFKAAFGVDAVREDAAAAAVRAGLAILAAAREFAAGARDALGSRPFDVRVGVSTGDAVLGAGIEAENSVTGEVVHLAARMEQTAPPGGLRISADTHAQVRGLFDVAEDAPIKVKGVEEPLRTYIVRGERAPGGAQGARGIEGTTAPMVGRADELAALQAALRDVREGKGMRVVTVVGEAGIGKTRLAHEFVDGIAAGVRELAARAHPDSVLQPYAVVRNLLGQHYGVAESDDVATVRAKLVDGLADTLAGDIALAGDPRVDAELLARLAGFDLGTSPAADAVARDPRALRARGERALAAWIRALCAAGPVVLLLEDLHWADAASLEMIAALLQRARTLPLLVIALARPTLFDTRADWPGPGAQHRRVDLHDLDAGQSHALAAALLARMPEASAELRTFLAERAGGNPFYMEELLRVLLDDGVIVRRATAEGEVWELDTGRLSQVRMPGTLTGVLQARLAGLPAPQRQASEAAAVIGPVFWDQAVAVVEPAAVGELDDLVTRGIVRERATSAFAEAQELAFRHHLLHQVAYDMVPKDARRRGHERAAAWLAARVSERSGEHLAITAEHYRRAGNRAAAADYFERAATAAQGRYANVDAVAYVGRALDQLAADEPDARWRLQRRRADLCDSLGQRAEQENAIDELERIAGATGNAARKAEAAFMRALLADRRGDYLLAIEHATTSAALAEAAGDWNTAARAFGERAFALAQTDSAEVAREWARQGLACAVRADNPLTHAQLLAVSAHVEREAANFAGAMRLVREAIELAKAHGHRRLVGLLAGNLGIMYEDVGEYGPVRACYEENLAIAREVGDRNGEVSALCQLALACLREGEVDRSVDLAGAAVNLAVLIQDRYREAKARRYMALAQSRRGEVALAEQGSAEAAAFFEEAGLRVEAMDTRALRADIAFDAGDLAGALAHVEGILAEPAAFGPLGAAPNPSVAFACYRVLERAHDARAGRVLEGAHAEVLRRCAALHDPALQRSFMENVALHRDIVKAWDALPARGMPTQAGASPC